MKYRITQDTKLLYFLEIFSFGRWIFLTSSYVLEDIEEKLNNIREGVCGKFGEEKLNIVYMEEIIDQE